MIEVIPLPADLLSAPAYRALTDADKTFIIELYALFHDAERFTIDMERPLDYRQLPGAKLSIKVSRLLRAGLILIVGKAGLPSHERRVFALTYRTMEEVAA